MDLKLASGTPSKQLEKPQNTKVVRGNQEEVAASRLSWVPERILVKQHFPAARRGRKTVLSPSERPGGVI